MDIFGDAHDPTTLNRQGADVGTQYRSTIMYLSESQKKTAAKWKSSLSDKLVDPVVTEIVPAQRLQSRRVPPRLLRKKSQSGIL